MANKTKRICIRVTDGQLELLNKMAKTFCGPRKGAKTDTILFAIDYLYNNYYKHDEEPIISIFDL